MKESSIREFSLVLSGILFVLLNINFIKELLSPFSNVFWISVALEVILGTFGIVFFHHIILRFLYYLNYHKFYGKWVYRSSSTNFGLAEIKLARGSIDYNVSLYDYAQIMQVLNKDNKAPHPWATARKLFSAVEDNELNLVYEVNYNEHSYLQRKGILSIKTVLDLESSSHRRMIGKWESTVKNTSGKNEDDVRIGTLHFYKVKDFLNLDHTMWSK